MPRTGSRPRGHTINLLRYVSTVAFRWVLAQAYWQVSHVADHQQERVHWLMSRPAPLPLNLAELRVTSQNGEDGVTWEIARRVLGSPLEGTFLEVGANAVQSNCLQLAQRAGWSGTFIDMGERQTDGLRRAFQGRSSVSVKRVRLDSVSLRSLLTSSPRVDLISIDVDGSDLTLVEALPYAPGILIVEVNSSYGLKRYTRAHHPAWDRSRNFGASVDLMDLAAGKLGMTRVYVESTGTNAFYIRNDLMTEFLAHGGAIDYSVIANYYGLGLEHPRPLGRFR